MPTSNSVNIARTALAEEHSRELLLNLRLPSPTLDGDTGFMIAECVAARVGVQPYPEDKQLGPHAAYRDMAFIEELANRLRDKPLADGHVSISPTKNIDKMVGLISEARVTPEGLLICRVVIHDEDLIRQLKDRSNTGIELGLSVGYKARLVPMQGEWTDTKGIAGIPGQVYRYQFQQVSPLPNHLAVVPLGRGGPLLRFADEAGNVYTDLGDSGAQLYPYPDKHVNATTVPPKRRGKKAMPKENEDNAMMGYDELKSRMDTMEKAIKDMPGMMNDQMKEMKDALIGVTEFVSTLRSAYENQDRPTATETASAETIASGIRQAKFLKDGAEEAVDVEKLRAEVRQEVMQELADSFNEQVGEAVSLWVEHKDEFIKAGVEDFSMTPNELRAKHLEVHGITLDLSDAAPEVAARALRSAYDSFAAREKSAPAKKNEPTQVQKIFNQMQTVQDGFGESDLVTMDGIEISRTKSGSVQYSF